MLSNQKSYYDPKFEVKCYLTGGEDEVVTGQVRLVAEDVWFFHLQLACCPQKPQQVIVYCHSSNSLQVILILCCHSEYFSSLWEILVLSYWKNQYFNQQNEKNRSHKSQLLDFTLKLVHIPKHFHVFIFDLGLTSPLFPAS